MHVLEDGAMDTIKGDHFTAAEAGPWADLAQHGFVHPKAGNVRGKLFLQKLLGLTSMEVSLGIMPPGVGLPFLHRHRQHEELYIFVGGEGQFQVDGKTLDVREGTVIRVAPEGVRSWRNNSTGPLTYICIQAAHGTVKGDATSDGAPVHQPLAWP
jgi:mannose-6-phosphate isomerase-like protein (cupin superfamily)